MSSRDLLLAASGVSTGGGGGGSTTDANFNQVSLLLHGDGTNGAQNNTFLDSSTNNFSITRNGNTTQGTNTPFSQAAGYWSNFFDGSSTYLNAGISSAYTFGTGDFTVECWVYPQVIVDSGIFQQGTSLFPTSTTNSVAFGVNTSNTWQIYAKNTNTNSTATIAKNTWNHAALVRYSGTTTLYINGVAVITIASDTTNYTGTYFGIGGIYGGNYFTGYISNIRIVKGTAVYTTTFTPPTAPLTAITNTSLLTCQSSYFKDNSSNNYAITATGTPSVQPFSPFAPTSAYSTSVNGGSMYYDGTGDNLTFPSGAAFQFGTGDFTVESWAYLTSAPTAQYIIDARNSGQTSNWAFGWGLSGTNGILSFFNGSTTLDEATISVTANTWAHCVTVRSGTTLSIFVNGVRVATTTDSTNFSISPTTSYIGSRYTNNVYMIGYLSNIRTVKGTAVYNPTLTTLTVPTAPLTAITNTSLLLSGTNAGIYDNAIKNDLETVGNAQVSTSVVKYGTGSMKFNGYLSGMYLKAPPSQQYYFGTGDFTIEGWVYANNTTQNGGVFQLATTYFSASYTNQLAMQAFNGNLYLNNNAGANGSYAYSANTWYHLAASRQGTSLKFFVNGTQSGATITDSTNYTGTYLVVGALYDTPYCIDGYIDDFRITKGIARYTANFTPPTQAFPNQ